MTIRLPVIGTTKLKLSKPDSSEIKIRIRLRSPVTAGKFIGPSDSTSYIVVSYAVVAKSVAVVLQMNNV